MGKKLIGIVILATSVTVTQCIHTNLSYGAPPPYYDNGTDTPVYDNNLSDTDDFLVIDFDGMPYSIKKNETKSNGEYEYFHLQDGIMLLKYLGDGNNIVLPDAIDNSKVIAVYKDAFYGKDITSMTISNISEYKDAILTDIYSGYRTSKVKDSFEFLNALDNLQNIYVTDNNEFLSSIDGVLYSKDLKTLCAYPKGRKEDTYNVNKLCEYIFDTFNCKDLKDIYIPNAIKYVDSEAINNKNIYRQYSLDNINISASSYELGRPININLNAKDAEGIDNKNIHGNIIIENNSGYSKTYSDVKVDTLNNANVVFVPSNCGTYKVTAYFYDDYGKSQSKTSEFNVNSNAYEISYDISPKSYSSLNSPVTLTAKNGEDSLYKFVIEHNGDYETIKDYSSENKCIWIPNDGGVYNAYVYVKRSNGTEIIRSLCSNYLVSYNENSINEIKDQIYDSIINNKIFVCDKYFNGNTLLSDEDKSFLNILATSLCLDKDAMSDNDYLRISCSNKIYRINLPYNKDTIKIKSVINNFKNKYIKENMSELEKEMAVVRYLKDNCYYDYEAVKSKENKDDSYNYEESYTAYGALVNKKATCKGYSEAAEVLLESLNIDCSTISSRSLDHVWNIVKIDGKYYELDVTWIDTTSNGTDNDFFNFSNKDPRHYASDISNMEAYNKCINDNFDDININNYNIYLNKMVNFAGDYFYLSDVYGENYKCLINRNKDICYKSVKFSTGNMVSNYLINNCSKYFYYCTVANSDNIYEIRKIDLENAKEEVIKKVNSPCELDVYNGQVIIKYNGKKETIETIDNSDDLISNKDDGTSTSTPIKVEDATGTASEESDNNSKTGDSCSYGSIFAIVTFFVVLFRKWRKISK